MKAYTDYFLQALGNLNENARDPLDDANRLEEQYGGGAIVIAANIAIEYDPSSSEASHWQKVCLHLCRGMTKH